VYLAISAPKILFLTVNSAGTNYVGALFLTSDQIRILGKFAGLYPIGGISGKRILLCNESGQWLTYISDRFGFNNNPSAHDVSNTDVALVGDLFTEGYCVPHQQNAAGVLSSFGLQVANFGKGGVVRAIGRNDKTFGVTEIAKLKRIGKQLMANYRRDHSIFSVETHRIEEDPPRYYMVMSEVAA